MRTCWQCSRFPHRTCFLPLKAFNMTVVNIKNSCAIASAISGHFSRRLIEGILLANRGGHRIPFDIPAELRQTWGLN